MDGVGPEDTLKLRGIVLDADGRTLLLQGRSVELDNRCLAIFRALAADFGKKVGKDDLLAAGWPNQVVHENSLAKAISRLRRALDGSGVEIVASYGIGYLLRDDATSEGWQGSRAVAPQEVAAGASPSARSKHRWMLAIGAITLLAAAAIFLFNMRDRPSEVAIRTAAPITNDAPGHHGIVLWVDDNPSNNDLEISYLRQHNVAVHKATSTDDALKLLGMNAYRLVVSDLGRGDDRLAGLKMIEAMSKRGINTPVVIYTVRPDDPDRQRTQRQLVLEAGAADLALTPQEVRSKIMARVAVAQAS